MRSLRQRIAKAERVLGLVALLAGFVSSVSWRVLDGDEHRYVLLVYIAIITVVMGPALFVAGLMLSRPGRAALIGQALPLGVAVYWVWLLG